MKNWKKHFPSKRIKLFSLSIVGLGAMLTFFAFMNYSKLTTMNASPAFQMGYNVEQVSTTTYVNATGTCYEGISQLSDAENYTVNCIMSDQGDFQLTVDIGQSSQDVSQQGYEEPNLRKIGKVKMDNNTMTTYDTYGNVIESAPNQGGELSVASLKTIVQMSSQDSYNAIVAAAQSGGTLLSPTGETLLVENKGGLIRLRSTNEEYVFNPKKRVIQAITNFDSSGKIQTERIIDAERLSNGSFMLYAIHDMTYDPIPNSSAVAVTKITQEFKNFSLVDFIGTSTLSK